MQGFTKLWQSIVSSTVWREEPDVKVVWVTLLALANRVGVVQASVPGLAALANVSLEQCVAALAKFAAPDKWSRTKDREGRRIEEVDGGWVLINHGKYRNMRDEDTRREQVRQAVARHRARKGAPPGDEAAVIRSKPRKAHAEAEAEAEADPGVPRARRAARTSRPSRPRPGHAWHDDPAFKALVALWPVERRGNLEAAFATWEGQGAETQARLAAEVGRIAAAGPAEKLGALSAVLLSLASAPYVGPAVGAVAGGAARQNAMRLLREAK